MLNRLDDYHIHQTSDPVAVPMSSDRNVYDRAWYNGYSNDGAYYFGFGLTFYPHRSLLDCHFSIVERGGRQHCFFGSRRAPAERTEMTVGPLRYEILEPMRSVRLVLDDNESGISCDLVFEALSPAILEPKLVFWSGNRRVRDSSRFAQFGRWSGTIRHPDGEILVEPLKCRATKDRSWGIRSLGEPEGGAPPLPSDRAGMFFVWAPFFWEDHATHALIYENADGQPIQRSGFTVPLLGSGKDIPADGEHGEHLADVAARVRYAPDTRQVAYAELDLIDTRQQTRTIRCEPLLTFYMKGLGYNHPKWAQGIWHGEMALGHETFDPASIDVMVRENMHVQQVVRLSDGERHGIGAFEHICTGPLRNAFGQ